MLPAPTLPESWRALLEAFRPAFRRSRRSRCSPCWLPGWSRATTRAPWSACSPGRGWPRWCRSTPRAGSSPTHAWDTDRLGLALARLIVTRLLAADAPIEVVVDDTLFRRWGPKVFGAFWTHDGSAQDPNALGRGNRWVIVGIVVALPFCSHPVCLPVLLRLWRGKGTASPVQLAGETDLASGRSLPGPTHPRRRGRRLPRQGAAGARTTITTRLPANAVLYAWRRRAPANAAAPG